MIGRKKTHTVDPRAPKSGNVAAIVNLFTLALQRAGATVTVEKHSTRHVVVTVQWQKGQ